MPVYERSTHVDAPFDDVWAFHLAWQRPRSADPDWLHLRIEESTGPDGQPDPDVLEEGATIVSSVRPFGVGPRQRWTSVIVDRREREGHGLFRDVMADGPFASWEHTHRFTAEGEGRWSTTASSTNSSAVRSVASSTLRCGRLRADVPVSARTDAEPPRQVQHLFLRWAPLDRMTDVLIVGGGPSRF